METTWSPFFMLVDMLSLLVKLYLESPIIEIQSLESTRLHGTEYALDSSSKPLVTGSATVLIFF